MIMKMRALFLLVIAGISLLGSLVAATPDDISVANQSLSSGHPAEALASYQSMLDSPGLSKFSSPELWYNRGLAEERSGDPIAASLSYRRALLLDPTLLSAHIRLSGLLASLGIPASTNWNDRLFLMVPPDMFILGGAILGWLGVLLFVFFILSTPCRPGLIAFALLAMILGHGLTLFGAWNDPRRLASDEAVVTVKNAPTLRETPADSSKADGTLAPGSLVTILSRNGAWWKVSGGAASTGWIPSTAITPLLPAAAGS